MSPVKPTLDLLFLQDTTASQGPYINAARLAILEIVQFLRASGAVEPGGFRVGHTAFRDYKEGPSSYLLHPLGFTTDFDAIQRHLDSLTAVGGGDPAEAVEAALHEARERPWAKDAVKVAILITDAPPHGIGERYDDFPNGSPQGYDPIQLAKKLAHKGVSLYILACEPSLTNGYKNANDFYRALAYKGNGAMYPLNNSKLLCSCIIGFVLERVQLHEYALQYQEEIARQVFVEGKPVEKVIDNLLAKMGQNGDMITGISTNSPYKETNDSFHNLNVWLDLNQISKLNPADLRIVEAHNRFVAGYDKRPENARPEIRVQITIKNLSESFMRFSVYENDQRKMVDVDMPPNAIHVYEFRLHLPNNFMLTRGLKTSWFCRSFTRADAIDIAQIFDLTATS